MSLTFAELRMKAIRLEEQELWNDAADAWRSVISEFSHLSGNFVSHFRADAETRLKSAEHRVEELMAGVRPVYKVEAVAEAEEKPRGEREPTGVNRLDSGPVEGDTGAR